MSQRAMYERSYGAKYEALGPGWHGAAEIAKAIRADIKAAVTAGDLPGSTKNYSVRSESFSGGQAIRVVAKGLPGMWQVCQGIIPGSEVGMSARSCGNVWCKNGGRYADSPHATEHDILSLEGRRVEKLLKEIHSAYNHDGSEVQVDYFDVRYYGHAEIERLR